MAQGVNQHTIYFKAALAMAEDWEEVVTLTNKEIGHRYKIDTAAAFTLKLGIAAQQQYDTNEALKQRKANV